MIKYRVTVITDDLLYVIPENKPSVDAARLFYSRDVINGIQLVIEDRWKEFKAENVRLKDRNSDLESQLKTEKILAERHIDTLRERDKIISTRNDVIKQLEKDIELLRNTRNHMAEQINDLNNKLHRYKRVNLKRSSQRRKARRDS